MSTKLYFIFIKASNQQSWARYSKHVTRYRYSLLVKKVPRYRYSLPHENCNTLPLPLLDKSNALPNDMLNT